MRNSVNTHLCFVFGELQFAMGAEVEKVNCVDQSSKMQTLTSRKLPELIELFELKFNQQKDVSHVKSKSARPAAKMKARVPKEVLEIARLKLLISEIREKTMKMEAQLKSAAEKRSEEARNNVIAEQNNLQEKEHDMSNLHLEPAIDKVGDNLEMSVSPQKMQDLYKKEKKDRSVEQEFKLDKDVLQLQECIKNLQHDIKVMALQLSSSSDLQEELTTTKSRIKDLQEEIRDDASNTKAQLLVLKQQFEELEKANNASNQKELEFQKVSQIVDALEVETEVLKKGNQELLVQTQEISQKLQEATENAENIVPVTKDDVLAARDEVLTLCSSNAELQKKVETLQISRFNEVEEVVYLRWVNACLRHDLDLHKCSLGGEISNQAEKCNPLVGHCKDDSSLYDSFEHSVRSYNNLAENTQEQDDCTIPCSPQNPGHVSCANSTTPSGRYNQRRINVSPLAIPHEHISTYHTSPLTSPLGQVEGNQLCPSASPAVSVDGNPLSVVENIHGLPKSRHVPPQNSVQDGSTTNSGLLDPSQQHSQSNNNFPTSPNELNPQHNDPTTHSGSQKVADIQLVRPSKLDLTSYITVLSHSSPRRLGRNFARSSSNLSASPEGSISQAQGSPHMQDGRKCMRSPSNLFADSGISSANHTVWTPSISRRHSASSGAEPPKRENFTGVKAHSLDSKLDTSDRVVASFRRLSVSSQTPHRHRTFKQLSRQNSSDEKGENEVEQAGRQDTQLFPAKSTKADFIWDLARAIEVMHYSSIEQVSAFVDWFSKQGETEKQEFWKFPDFPRDKVKAMRRAVNEYDELKALDIELRTCKDKLKGTTNVAIKDMKTLLEKVENHIQAFKQARDLAIVQFGEFDVPTDWMLDSGAIAKIKRTALQLAQACIKQVTNILVTESECMQVSRDTLLLAAAKFLLQVHNFTGGFDKKTSKAFTMLQNQADVRDENVICQSILS